MSIYTHASDIAKGTGEILSLFLTPLIWCLLAILSVFALFAGIVTLGVIALVTALSELQNRLYQKEGSVNGD